MHDPHPHFSHSTVDNPLFEVRHVTYQYPDCTPALADINLEISSGDRIALVGQNGSGKTTLMKILCGLLTPSEGRIHYRSRPLRGEHLNQSRLKIGLLFQDPDDQLFGHTLMDDISFGPRHQGLNREKADRVAMDALKSVQLDPMAYKAPHNLSFGQKKRAALAGLLAMNPEVLLLDEPTTNLDPSQEQLFSDLLRGFAGTLVCISHDLIFLYDLCDRAVVMGGGKIQHDYTVHELVSQRSALRSHGLDFSFRFILEPEQRKEAPHSMAMPRHHDDTLHHDNTLDNHDTMNHDVSHHQHDHDRNHQHPDHDGRQLFCSHTHRKGEHSPTSDGFCLHSNQGPLANQKVTPLIHLKAYHYRYPDNTPALSGIDITVLPKEKIALVGENGAGKTTLLSCLMGLRQGRGTFLFDGKPITKRRQRKLWQQVGMVFQDSADQLFCPSVKEEVLFGLRQLKLPRAEATKRMRDALALVHLEGYEDRVPLHMSGGERKRLALACVLAMAPEVIILDEPTAGLDPQGEELLLNIIQHLDATLILVSHDMFFVRELTERAIVMHRGKIVADMAVASFLADKALGNLNGLAYAYRRQVSDDIRLIQDAHEHEHSHLHHHLHSHPHRHGDRVHEHLHEHAHAHPHRFFHTHPGEKRTHDHAPRRYHDHDHPNENHTHTPHNHDHPEDVVNR